MTTMLEVAKRAGVSKATVSRVLSGNGYVSQETKDRVFQAIEESGYRPNLLARNLATKRTQTLGLVVTNTLYHGVYFSELLFHAARMTEEKGRQLILADGKHSADEEREAIQYLLDMRCDAVIIYPRFLSVEEMDAIVEKCEQPIMVLNRRLRKNSSQRTEVSFDEPLNTDWDGKELLLSDVLGTEGDVVLRPIEADADRKLLSDAVGMLSQRERAIITMRFGLWGQKELTQKEVADRLGISQSYISRLEKRIILRLRREIVKMS